MEKNNKNVSKYCIKEKILGIIGVVTVVALTHLAFNHIVYGQELREPPTIEYAKAQHVVSEGDTFWLIAGWYKISLDALIHANPQIDDPNLIFPYEKINIPNNLESWKEKDDSGYKENLK
jgi:spore coat assembly protein SafA